VLNRHMTENNNFDNHKFIKAFIGAKDNIEKQAEIIGYAIKEHVSPFMPKKDVENKVSKTQTELKQDILEVKVELAETKSELKQEIAEVKAELAETKSELKQEIAEVKAELKQDILEVKTELTETKAELKADIKITKSELKQEIVNLGSQMEKSIQRNNRWQIATIISIMAIFVAVMKL